MSHPPCGTAEPGARRSTCVLAAVALCLMSIPLLAKSADDPFVPERVRPRPARARLIGEPRLETSSVPRSPGSARGAPLTPKPEERAEPTWFWLEATREDNAVLFRAPVSRSREPARPRVTIMLHGMCDIPQNECPSFAASTSSDWLVCPRASLECNGGGATWGWGDRVARVESATGRALQGQGATGRRTLIGFSLGATTALEVAQQGSERYDALVLIAARVYPDARKLKARGVKRVLLAAGDFDSTMTHLRTEAVRLERAGLDARFMSLGRVGHQFALDMRSWLDEALAWAERRAPASAN